MRRVTLYTRRGCHLCEDVQRIIAEVRTRAEFDYEEADIDADPELLRRYNDEVPVVLIDGQPVFRYHIIDMTEFLKRLAVRA